MESHSGFVPQKMTENSVGHASHSPDEGRVAGIYVPLHLSIIG